MKKLLLFCAVALIMAGMLIIRAQSLPAGSDNTSDALKSKVIATSEMALRVENLSNLRHETRALMGIKEEMGGPMPKLGTGGSIKEKQVTERLHPAITDGGDGYLIQFWENYYYQTPAHITLQMRGSTNGGSSWYTPTVWALYYPPGYYGFFPQPDSSAMPEYPSLGHWGSRGTYTHVFYGTCVCPFEYHVGGEPQIFVIEDIMNDSLWAKWRWAFDESAGTRDMKHAEIAVDSGQYYENPAADARPWGMQGILLSQILGEDPHTDAPYTFWQFTEDGYALISYYPSLGGCQSIDADIDPLTETAYSCFDWPNPDAGGQYALYVRSDPWDLMTKESEVQPDMSWDPYLTGWSMTSSTLNLEHPVMAVHGGNLVILTELVDDLDPSNVDIISWHCFDGDASSFTYLGIVAGSEDNERYPEIAWVEGNYFIAVYWLDNKLYACKSCGGGIWSDSVQVSLDGDIVPMDYHVADIADNGTKLIYSYTSSTKQTETELRIVDLSLDIFPASSQGPYTPDVWSPEDGAVDVPPDSAVLIWIGGDPDGDCMNYEIYLGTEDPPPLVATQSASEFYNYPGTLEPNTIYYWQIVAIDDQGSATSPVWTFITGSIAPNTVITHPSDTAFWNDHPYFTDTLHVEAVDHKGKSEVAYAYFEYFDGAAWQHFYTDMDGTDNRKDTYDPSPPEGDGWSGYWGPVGVEEGYYPIRATLVDYYERESSDTIVVYYDPNPPVPVITFPEVFNYLIGGPVDIEFVTDADNVAEMWVTVLPAPTSYGSDLQDEGEKLDCFQGFNKGIPSFNQTTLYPNGDDGYNYGCYPTSVAACLKYWAQNGYPGLDGNGTMTDGQMVNEIADSMGTDRNSGTTDAEAKSGAEAYIEGKLGPCKFKVEHLHGDEVTLKRYLKELFENDEDVIPSDPEHVVVGNSFCVHPQFYVDFMDPGTGTEVQSTDWNQGFDGDKLVDMLVISPKEDTTVEVPDTLGIPEETEPGNYHFPWTPDPEEYPRGYAYFVEVIIIDDMGHVGWDMVKIEYVYLRGDANYDGEIDVDDVVYLINWLYREGPYPDPFLAGDATCDDDVDIDDVVFLINYLFKGGDPPQCRIP